ncbi:MAG TPA: carbohydrate binding domain-containing protein [Microbacterium sp.]|nr:carbohydrate binding domain-containing protein [Microbacterium sp.]
MSMRSLAAVPSNRRTRRVVAVLTAAIMTIAGLAFVAPLHAATAATGPVTTQTPALISGSLSLYYKAPSGWSAVNAHYRAGSGAWTSVPGKPMTAVAECAAGSGWFHLTVDAGSASSVTAAFNNGSGTWDNNGGKDYTFTTATAAVNSGTISEENPCAGGEGIPSDGLDGELALFYKARTGWTSVNAHYRSGSGAWTSAPGKPMTAVAACAAGAGWFRLTIDSGSASSVTAAFNNGSGTWDNNGGKDYTFTTATAAVNAGTVTTTDPCGATEETVPAVPTEVTAVPGLSSIKVAWKAVADATGYTVAYRATPDAAPTEVTVTGTSHTITGLAASTEYVLAVRAQNAVGASAYSPAITATTTSSGPVTGEPGGSVAGATTGEPLGGDPREDSIYFIMTARWNDGVTSNNMGGSMHVKSGNAANDDPMFRGDFQGIIDKLDYIKGLGFSAIWITPVVTNRSDYDFHGYHGWDFQRIDPRLETPGATYQELIDAAHAEGMKIYQDVVYNHTSRWGETNLFTPTVYGTRDAQWSWYYDETVPGKVYNPTETDADGSTYTGDLWSQTQPADQNCKNWGVQSGYSAEGYKVYNCQWPNATSGMFPSDKFHQCWIGNWEGKDAQDCWIHEDLADLNTESAVVQDYLIDTYNKYIDMGVDGFRVDTAVHIPRVMWNRHFLPALQQHAQDVHGEKGKDFYVFGEVAQFVHDKWNRGSVNHSAPFYTWDERREYSQDDVVAAAEQFSYENLMGPDGQPTSTNHLLDGNTYHAPDHSKSSGMDIIDMRMHMNFDNASNAFHSGMDSDSATNDATFNAVYVDSHDYGPGKSNVRFDGGTAAWAEDMSLMWTFRGIPVMFYGSEIEFQAGQKIDCGPTCPLATTGRAYYGDHLEGEVEASDFGVVSSASGQVAATLEQPLVAHLQALNQIRRAVPALQKGQYSTEGVSGDMAFKRRFTEGAVDSFVLVAISGGASFSGIPNGTYVDAVTGDTKVVTNGSLTVPLAGKGNMRAYVLSLPGNPAPGQVGDGSAYLK